MRRRAHPLKWPGCIAVALCTVVVGSLMLPAEWIEAFFSPLVLQTPAASRQDQAIVLLPADIVQLEGEVAIVADDAVEGQARYYSDAEWWRWAWQVRLRQEGLAGARASATDSGDRLPAYLADLHYDFATILRQVDADSALAAHLALLRLEDRYDLGAARDDPGAAAMQRAYSDFSSRTAAAFDEHLFQTIGITDTATDRERREARARSRRR